MVRRELILPATGWPIILASLAAVGLGAAAPARAENLDEGKSAAQLFSSNCSVCHKSVRDLSKSAQGAGLQSFLRQHYTTGTDMARLLAGYVNAQGGSASRETREARPAAAPAVPRTVELPPRRPEAEVDDGERPEPRRAAAANPSDRAKPESGKPERARAGAAKPEPAKPEPAKPAPAAEAALPLAADLAPARAAAGPSSNVAQAKPVDAGPAEAKPAEARPTP